MYRVACIFQPQGEGPPEEVYITFTNGSLNLALESISRQVVKGRILLSAELIPAEGSPIPLPIEAFDGSPMAVPLSQLQAQWEAILIKPC